jgi:hypothetical protein
MSEAENMSLAELKKSSYKDNFDEVLSHLRDGLMRDYTIEEACFYAGINKLTYYRWMEKCNEFKEMMEKAKSYIARMAKRNIAQEIASNGDIDVSTWWLKHRRRDLYSTRNETSGPDGGPVVVDLNSFKDLSDEELEDLSEKELQEKLTDQTRKE